MARWMTLALLTMLLAGCTQTEVVPVPSGNNTVVKEKTVVVPTPAPASTTEVHVNTAPTP